ncbi:MULTISPECIES: alpha/beta fold hydrolase [unclassified Crossiella]|uniref:alpha/beta fold hydrolase n=1 Tax=unclassified Crossiella TaxID=2620835 RepID=UPI001FFE310D|nr:MULTISPECIES: alpha/beta hydrolase [unclassified Crossiella]MCK2244780.1 alpha/beta hydrolase [Crossiella sp. S99.2]MCK2258422.1 alpha/beta hydrolase [Crossiella sp. S99.1]
MSDNKPTVVLVHGAFADSSSWNGVVPRLREQGFPVLAVANPLRGVASDAAYVADVVNSVPGPVVLVGHSYGGVLISRAASETPNVQALVYIAAFQPDEGESVFDLSGRFAGGKLGPDTTNVLVHQGVAELSIKPADFAEVFAGDVDPAAAAVLAVTQRPVAEQALAAAFDGAPGWRKLPSWALIANGDHAIPAAAQEFMADRAGSTVRRIDASHAVAVSQPDAVADLIVAAASA